MPLAITEQASFAAGMWRGFSRDAIPPDGCYDLTNLLLDEQGIPYKRGGSDQFTAYFAADLTNPTLLLWDGILVGGPRLMQGSSSELKITNDDFSASSSTFTIGRAGVTGNRPVAVNGTVWFDEGFYAGSLGTVDYTTGTVDVTQGSTTVVGHGTSWSAAGIDKGLILEYSGYTNVVDSVTDNTHLQLRWPWTGPTGALVAYALRRFSGVFTPAADVKWAAAANRVLRSTGSRVYFSHLANAVTPPGQFPSTNLDFHDIPDGSSVLAMQGLANQAYVFTTSGVFLITGLQFDLVDDAGNVQQSIEPVTSDLKLWGELGLSAWRGVVVAPCVDGVYLLTPGTAPTLVSEPIGELYRSYSQDPAHTPGQAVVYRDHYLLPIRNSSNVVVDVLACRLDLPKRPWSHLAGRSATCMLVVRRSASDYRLLGGDTNGAAFPGVGNNMVDLTGWFSQTTLGTDSVGPDTGVTYSWAFTSRDFRTGQADQNRVRRLRMRYEWTNAASQGIAATGTTDNTTTITLPGTAGAVPGLGTFQWPWNRRARTARVTITGTNDTAPLFKLRSVELFTSPSARY